MSLIDTFFNMEVLWASLPALLRGLVNTLLLGVACIVIGVTAGMFVSIVRLYAPDAVFLGTSSPVIRDTPALVEEYFGSLATLGDATNAVGEHRVQVFGDIAINSGYYTLTRRQDGKTTQSPARFSFVYQKRGGEWLIVSHHSSVLPAAR